ncbi:chromate transporter [Clostridium bornimense]|uniref:chromate transporter n=1 Tax=Clostridium bornimense TaxID=1216932 RepID=UPI001C108EC5|nr:chromate transporter [Clostridium bornimense]MBU5316024.1 chromate transporter [Clostridium bornimense]
MKKLLNLFWAFFKIGAFTFGGGYAMVPLIEKEIVEKQKWVDKDEFVDIIVLSQSFPGALAVNCSTMVGYKICGIVGAVVTLLAVVLPSFIIMLMVAMYLMKFRNNIYVNAAFKGINAAVPIMVLVAIVSLSKSLRKSTMTYIIMAAALIVLLFFDINPIWVIIASALFGVVYYGRGEEE